MKNVIANMSATTDLDRLTTNYNIKTVPISFSNVEQYKNIFINLLETEFKETLKREYNNKYKTYYDAVLDEYEECTLKSGLFFLFFKVNKDNEFSNNLKRNELVVIKDAKNDKIELFSIYINEIKGIDTIPLLV